MSEQNSERIITPMPPSLMVAIDDYRFKNRHPSRSEAIRRLIELGLEASRRTNEQKPPLPEQSALRAATEPPPPKPATKSPRKASIAAAFANIDNAGKVKR